MSNHEEEVIFLVRSKFFANSYWNQEEGGWVTLDRATIYDKIQRLDQHLADNSNWVTYKRTYKTFQ